MYPCFILDIFFLEIVCCAGGHYVNRMPQKKHDMTFVISCPKDRTIISKALKSGMNVQDKEVLLTGLLRQKLEFDAHKLQLI